MPFTEKALLPLNYCLINLDRKCGNICAAWFYDGDVLGHPLECHKACSEDTEMHRPLIHGWT